MSLMFEKVLNVSSGQILPERPPAGLAFLNGVCEHMGIEYSSLDLNLFINQELDEETWVRLEQVTPFYPVTDESVLSIVDDVLDKFCDRVQSFDPDLIMVSVLSYYQNFWAQSFLEKLKSLGLKAKVMIGGTGIGVPLGDETKDTFAKMLLRKELIDYYVLGEGDMILQSFLRDGTISPGINHRNTRALPGTETETWAQQIDELDQCPTPSYKQMDLDSYPNELGVTGSRGCVRRCTFCDVGHYWKKFRFRSGESIAREIEQHYRDTGRTRYVFTDSLINGSLKSFRDMLATMAKVREDNNGMPELQLLGQFIIRPSRFHPEQMFREMRTAGIHELSIGVESGSEKVREHIGKKFSNEDIDWHMEMCSKYGIQNNLLMMVGYPTETEEDFNESMDMLDRYQKYTIDKTVRHVNESYPLVLLKNTPLHHMADDLDISGFNDQEYFNVTWVSGKNPKLTIHERFKRFVRWQRRLIKLGYWRPQTLRVIIRELMRQIENLSERTLSDRVKTDILS